MSTTKIAVPLTALLCTAIVTSSASAESGRTLQIDTFRGTSALHHGYTDCISTSIDISVGRGESWRSPGPSSLMRNTFVSFEVIDYCQPGARKSISGSLNLATAPAIPASFNGVDLVVEAEVTVWACAEQPDGLFECHEESVPLLLEAHWLGRGLITRSTDFSRLPQGDGTTLLSTTRNSAREASVNVSGTLGEHVIDFANSDTYIYGNETLGVQVPSRQGAAQD